MPYQAHLRSDLEQQLQQLDPSLKLLEPEDPGFHTFLASVNALDPTLARKIDSALVDDQALAARALFSKAGGGLTVASVMAGAMDRAKGKSVRGDKRFRPGTFVAIGAGVVVVIFLFTAFAPDNATAKKAAASTSTTGGTTTTVASKPASGTAASGSSASASPGTPGALPTSTVSLPTTTPAPSPTPVTEASTPAPVPSTPATPVQNTPAPVPITAASDPVRLPVQAPTANSSRTTPAQGTRNAYAAPPLALTPPPPTRAFSGTATPSAPAARAALVATGSAGQTSATLRTAVVSAVPATSPARTTALSSSGAQTPPPTSAIVSHASGAPASTSVLVTSENGRAGTQSATGLTAQASSATPAVAGFVSSSSQTSTPSASQATTGTRNANADSAGLVATNRAVSDSPQKQAPVQAEAAQDTPAPVAQAAFTSSAGTTGGLAQTAPSYSPGMVVALHLDTGIAVYPGVTHPVWARGDDASIWRGTAALDDKSGRITMRFTTVLNGGRQQAINAYAETPDGEGIGDHTQTVSKDAARAVVNGLLGAVVNFVQSQSAKTTTVSQGFYSQSEKPQNFWLALGSGLASAFVVPDVRATSVQLGQMQSGEAIRVRVDVQGNAEAGN